VFVLNAGVSFLPGVSWEGHLGGGVAGLLAAGLLNVARFGDQRRRIVAWILLALLPVFSVAGLVAAMDANGIPAWQRLRQRLDAERGARESLERIEKLTATQSEFNTQVLPRLAKLSPTSVVRVQTGLVPLNTTPLELEAVLVLKEKQPSPERVRAVREKVLARKLVAVEVVDLTSREATGVERFDRQRERILAFATLRLLTFDLLLSLLDAPHLLNEDVWKAWHANRQVAEQLWLDLFRK
jgi:hypothetical protein